MDASEHIDHYIGNMDDWRGKTLAAVRKAMLAADKAIIEEWKWRGSPAWSRDGMIAVANAHKDKVKVTFSHGAKLPDPDKLFNNGLGGSTWRAIDIHEDDKLDAAALKRLVKAAIAFNLANLKKNARLRAPTKTTRKPTP
ncbi:MULTISPECIES: DUF1801 domain-containing protein [Dyella]|uniref:DUF1801 domain-containing protein n=2 Tax=Dyella TaxID=231454 RepID=A0A4R0YUG6_9GAMM|nr:MULTISPECIES: DUF1801 domain-containing protein [Dyella]TBR39483.1 DUF1801 domain-containing protein [Dyella terrae]TCI12932.1 DUF1801 domain-containing protein [Dyella soli]